MGQLVPPTVPRISKFDISLAFSKALDMVSPKIVDHQKRVALISAYLAEEVALDGFVLSMRERHDLIIAGLLHDIGAVSVVERLSILQYDTQENDHATNGAKFLRKAKMFTSIAKIVHYHHQSWRDSAGASDGSLSVPFASFIVRLADRIEVLIDKSDLILNQVGAIRSCIQAGAGRHYHPVLVDAFLRLAEREAFWLDIVSPDLDARIKRKMSTRRRVLTVDELLDIAHMFAIVIDLRSEFTATHSFGVAATAGALGRHMGLDETHCRLIEVAGYLHDIGKLIIPQAILEKKGSLEKDEYNKIKTHTYYTFSTLSEIPGMREISEWAAYHHEQINGQGYPFHLPGEMLSTESRILAIADKFVALAEDRPYRKAMPEAEVIFEMRNFANEGQIDKDIAALLIDRFDDIDAARKRAQGKETKIINMLDLKQNKPRKQPEFA